MVKESDIVVDDDVKQPAFTSLKAMEKLDLKRHINPWVTPI